MTEPRIVKIGEPDRLGRRLVTIEDPDGTQRDVLTLRPLAELEAMQ